MTKQYRDKVAAAWHSSGVATIWDYDWETIDDPELHRLIDEYKKAYAALMKYMWE